MKAPPPRPKAAFPAGFLYGGAAVIVVALHLATNGTLGFHTDELYYIASGRHPAFGYVDFPPIVPLLARVETDLLGATPWALRLLPSLLGGFLAVLCGLYVRRLGGSLGLQAIGLLIGVTAPYLVGSNWVYQTVTFDEVTWMVALYWFLCLVIDRRPRYWIYLGIALGIALEVKFTVVALIAGIGVAVLVTPSLRKELRTRYPWIAAAIALLIWAPNIGWQAANGFPSLTYVLNHRGDISSGGGPVAYLILFSLVLFLLIPLWVAGMISLFRNRSLRPIGIAVAVPLVIFLFAGKSAYVVSTIPIVMAQGIMAISNVRRPRWRSALDIAVVAASLLTFVALAQLILPITPPDRLHAAGLDSKNEVFADSVGWVDVANQVTQIYRNLPPSQSAGTVIVSAYVGVPGALDIYGDPKMLPPVVSPQLSDYYWLPPGLRATNALMVDYKPSDVSWMCTSAQLIAHLTVPFQVAGLEQGAPVTFCRLKTPIPKAWPQLRNFS